MTPASLMLAGWALEAVFGWPDWLYRTVRHPVVWFGTLVRILDKYFNRETWPHRARYLAGMLAANFAIALVAVPAWGLSRALPHGLAGNLVEAVLVSSLIASRSLYQHVADVARPLAAADLTAARTAVSFIVGRDPSQLDEAGIARAALESLAENASDGIAAPIFWGAIFGLPGIVAYKAVNTLDSMIGHRNDRYSAYGGFAARLDDIANYVPARLTGMLIVAASGRTRALQTMFRDARRHRSPNAGWPESAMAGALGVRLSGPRRYAERTAPEPWLNETAPDPASDDVRKGLDLYVRAMILGAFLLGTGALAWELM
jgi:adenosylcobinamide-phosphate synthase